MFDEEKERNRLPDLPPARGIFDDFGLKRREDASTQPAFSKQVGKEEEDEESHALPAFPDTPSHNSFSEAAIKDAVEEDELPELPELPEHSTNEGGLPELPELPEKKEVPGSGGGAKVVEMEEWVPEHPMGMSKMKHKTEEYSGHIEVPRKEDFVPVKREIGSPDVFVKIDKFRSARKTFSEVKSKLSEIDDLIKKIRETKMREEQELNAWEKDVMQIKARVQDVSEDIFEKVE